MACARQPDYRTTPAPASKELVGEDPSGRDFEFYSRSIALLIGESGYLNWRKLSNVPQEMKSLTAALEVNGFEVLRYDDLKGSELRDVVPCVLASEIDRPGMRVLVFFAGHGATRTIMGNTVGYVVPVDGPVAPNAADLDKPEFRTTAVSMNQFVQWAEEIEAKHALFIFDSCFSGSILDARGQLPTSAKPSNYVFSDLANKPLREFIASGTAEQTVPEPSTFTSLLVQALLGEAPEADANHDDYVTSSELISYLKGFVPRYIPNETPVSGRIRDEKLDKGDFIFKLPRPNRGESVARAVDSSSSVTFRRVFRGAPGNNAKQIYEVEGLLTTKTYGCSSACVDGAPIYNLDIRLPSSLPNPALLDEVDLRCVAGDCANFDLVSGPSLAADHASAKVTFKAWGAPSTWRMTATVLMSGTGEGKIPVFDSVSKQVTALAATEFIPILTNSRPDPASDPKIKLILNSLESDDEPTRRDARDKLATVIALSSPEIINSLIRQVPTGSYRFQLGLMVALGKLNAGWNASDPIALDIVRTLVQKNDVDSTLKSAASRALSNLRLYAFYEVGADGWLTKAGQLRPINGRKPPLPAPASIAKNTVLQAASNVNLRSGPGSTSHVMAILNQDECVRVVDPDSIAATGQWMKVAQANCSPP